MSMPTESPAYQIHRHLMNNWAEATTGTTKDDIQFMRGPYDSKVPTPQLCVWDGAIWHSEMGLGQSAKNYDETHQILIGVYVQVTSKTSLNDAKLQKWRMIREIMRIIRVEIAAEVAGTSTLTDFEGMKLAPAWSPDDRYNESPIRLGHRCTIFVNYQVTS